MKEDKRCCGSGACIINEHGECWCGQRWDGTKMCYPPKPEPEHYLEMPNENK